MKQHLVRRLNTDFSIWLNSPRNGYNFKHIKVKIGSVH